MFSGRGSLQFGGRWNAPGTFRAVYASTALEVATAESLAYYRYYGFRDEDAMPRTMQAIDIKLHKVFDLTNPVIQRKLRIPWKQMQAEDWRKLQDAGKESLSQALGRAIFDVGMEGLVAPSAQVPSGINIVFFPEHQDPRSAVRIHRKRKRR
jgi:RES domain-containing protein